MPIVRSFLCESCGHALEVTLRADQWQEPPPECPACADRPMQQEFHAPAITGSHAARAAHMAHTIAHEDYGAEVTSHSTSGPRVRHIDSGPASPSSWGMGHADFQRAVAMGRQTRAEGYSGLEILQNNLRNGTQPDLIEASKRRSARVW